MADRLTARTEDGIAYLVNVKQDEQEVECKSRNTAQCILDSWERLATYEDAEEQGLSVRLPCIEGDTVWVISWCDEMYRGAQCPYGCNSAQRKTVFKKNCVKYCGILSKKFTLSDVEKMGKTVFLTRDAAKAALAKEDTADDK